MFIIGVLVDKLNPIKFKFNKTFLFSASSLGGASIKSLNEVILSDSVKCWSR